MDKKYQIIAQKLQTALTQIEGDTGPGFWVLDVDGNGQPVLAYEWPELNDPTQFYGDEPWKNWGGEEILASANCCIISSSMIDGVDYAVVDLI